MILNNLIKPIEEKVNYELDRIKTNYKKKFGIDLPDFIFTDNLHRELAEREQKFFDEELYHLQPSILNSMESKLLSIPQEPENVPRPEPKATPDLSVLPGRGKGKRQPKHPPDCA